MSTRIVNGVAIASGGTTVSSTAIPITDAAFGFTADELSRANSAWVTCAVNPVNYTEDGTTPTAGGAGGHQLPIQGGHSVWTNENVNALSFIAAGSDGAVYVTLFE